MSNSKERKIKVEIKYPHVVINTIEVEMTEEQFLNMDDDLSRQVDFINENVPGYECADYRLCKGAREVDMYSFKPLKQSTNERKEALR